MPAESKPAVKCAYEKLSTGKKVHEKKMCSPETFPDAASSPPLLRASANSPRGDKPTLNNPITT